MIYRFFPLMLLVVWGFSIVHSQELAGFQVGADFSLSCQKFFSTSYIIPDDISRSEDCFQTDRLFPETLIGKTTFLSFDYGIFVEEFNNRVEKVTLSGFNYRQYSKEELNTEIHTELYALSQHFSSFLGSPEVTKQISNEVFLSGRGSIEVMTWKQENLEAKLNVVKNNDTENYFVVAELVDLRIEVLHEQADAEIALKVDMRFLEQFTSSIFNELRILSITCPSQLSLDTKFFACGETNWDFGTFQKQWDYQLDNNESLGTIDTSHPWAIKNNGVYERLLYVNNVPFVVFFFDGFIVIAGLV